MLHRGFPLSAAFGRHQRMCIIFPNLGCLRSAAAAALTCDYRVFGSGAVSYTDLSAVRVLFNAELGCRYIRLRVDVDKNVDARHECFAYIQDHAAYARAFPDPATLTMPLDRVGSHAGRKSLAQWLWDGYRSARVIAHVGHWACRQDALDAYFKTSATEIIRLIAAL
eukprot:jgi/Tetstr1/440149/TSEL_028506.t1